MMSLKHISFAFRSVLLLAAMVFFTSSANAKSDVQQILVAKGDSVFLISAHEESSRPNPILTLLKSKQKKNKKVAAALLAFPFPFGMVGLHRIYLGTAPYVPVVYIGTLGGALGILPFIDFCVLMLDKDIDHYIENKNVLMWVQENSKRLK